MKKTLAVILSVIMAFSCLAVIGSAAGTDSLTFLIASDSHYAPTAAASAKGNMFEYSGAIIDEYLAAAKSSGANCVLFSGDIVETASAASTAVMVEKFAAFEAETGKQIYVIDGNHDVNASFSKDAFKAAYAQFGYSEAVAVDANSCSYAVDLNKSTRLIAIDTVTVGASTGTLTAQGLEWAKDQYNTAKAAGYTVLVMMHHPLVEHIPYMKSLMPNYVLTNGDEVAKAFAGISMSFVFTGHDHITDIASYTAGDNTVYDIGTGSLTADTCPYRQVTVTSDEIKVNTKNITSVPGFEGNFAAYAKRYFKDSASALLKNYINTKLLAGKLGVAEGSAAYTLIDKAVVAMNEMGAYPMDEFRQKASDVGITVPANGYTSYNDAIMEVLENIVAGNESINSTTELYKVLYTGAQAIMTCAFADIDDETVSAAINEILPKITEKISTKIPADQLAGMVSGLTSGNKETIIAAGVQLVFSAVVTDIGVDDKPSDHSAGYVNPFVHAEKAKLQSTWEKILAFFHKMLDFILAFFIR